ncbi:hypothetical protein Poly51_61110 [Rubripirellula tenax]|uniref:DUF1697 domain-containing protein n=1 Tax=Rubripirellula tenax TaxID=2528015 RepID=A0A5C6E7H7_9BACT|nr:DUF1697 domain-containing protein [Rubripirellula tenax]TWU44544.1 hypothetical protein Poly51_61110 [Rubripirellula tenax]
MNTWIALFRGINVGGRNKMPMAPLRLALESIGCRSVQTYIQSGNVLFDSAAKSKAKLTRLVGDATESEFGFRPTVLLLTAAEFHSAIANNPFPDAVVDPKTLHFFFLDSVPTSPDNDGLASLATSTERYQLVDSVFYLHAPDGFGRSKLASAVERKLGVATTARNYKTIHHLAAKLNAGRASKCRSTR